MRQVSPVCRCWALFLTISPMAFPWVSRARVPSFHAHFNTHDKANLSWIIKPQRKLLCAAQKEHFLRSTSETAILLTPAPLIGLCPYCLSLLRPDLEQAPRPKGPTRWYRTNRCGAQCLPRERTPVCVQAICGVPPFARREKAEFTISSRTRTAYGGCGSRLVCGRTE